ncbi:MAG: hypothetical protein ACRBF0_24445, partial [Calditrichia bacterium]
LNHPVHPYSSSCSFSSSSMFISVVDPYHVSRPSMFISVVDPYHVSCSAMFFILIHRIHPC